MSCISCAIPSEITRKLRQSYFLYLKFSHQQVNEAEPFLLNFPCIFVIWKALQSSQLKCRFTNNNLLVHPNQQEYQLCDINSLVPNVACSQLNYTLYWLVIVRVWSSYFNLKITKVGLPNFQLSLTWWNKYGFLTFLVLLMNIWCQWFYWNVSFFKWLEMKLFSKLRIKS